MVFEDAGLDDGIHGTRFFAETTEYALAQIDIVTGGAARTIGTLFGFNGNGDGRTYRLAEFSGNTPFLPIGIAAQRMQAAETRRLRGLLLGILHRDLAPEQMFARKVQTFNQLPEEQTLQVIFNVRYHSLTPWD